MNDVKIRAFAKPTEHDVIRCLSYCADTDYIALRRPQGPSSIRVVVCAGRQRSEKLSVEAQQWLYDQGYRRKRASQNFEKHISNDDFEPESMETFIEQTFNTCFGQPVTASELLEFPTFESEEQPVLDAMTFLSKQRDWAARKKWYRSFNN